MPAGQRHAATCAIASHVASRPHGDPKLHGSWQYPLIQALSKGQSSSDVHSAEKYRSYINNT